MSTTTAPAPTVSLQVNRLIKAPRDRVFAAWTTPADIMKWFGPGPAKVLSAKVDLRVGGEYTIRVLASHDCSGGNAAASEEMTVRGVYREVKAPSRLVYTWSWAESPAMAMDETVVTVDFVARDGGTEVQITHDKFTNPEVRDRHTHGWTGCLDKLEAQFSGPGCAVVGEFSWNELLTKDVAAAGKFYSQLFGWQAADFAGSPMQYTLFKQNGTDVGGMMKLQHDGVPPHWLSYVTVENVDATSTKATQLGGKIVVPAMDIPNVGRIAVFQDPQGAALGMFQPARK